MKTSMVSLFQARPIFSLISGVRYTHTLYRLGLIGTTLGDQRYDWAFTSVPQRYANNRQMVHPRYA